jgi:hypothetical protein
MPMVMIYGVAVTTNDARALITDLMASKNPVAFAAAVRIRGRLEQDTGGLVALEPAHRDALLTVLDNPRDGLGQLREVLVRDWEQRNDLRNM